MEQSVHSFIRKNRLLHDGATVIIAVSGGPDSLALLHFFWKEQVFRSLRLICAHVDHQLRGEHSKADYLFVEDFCRTRSIEFEGATLNVKSYMEERHLSLQIAARECRYRFFKELVEKYHADYLVLAHHGDDQIETMLMRQVRGNFGASLAGIPVKRPFGQAHIIRPFLSVSKKDILAYCEKEKLTPCHDESNDKDDYTRNRFRHHLLPFIKEENPKSHVSFQKQSEWLLDDEVFLTELAKKALEEGIIKKEKHEVILSIPFFLKIPFPLQRRAIHLILNYLYGKNAHRLATVHIEQILELIKTEHPSSSCDLPNGIRAVRTYAQLVISLNEEEGLEFMEETTLFIPSEVKTALGYLKTSYEWSESIKLHPKEIICPVEALKLPLSIRTRREGDRMAVKGLNGTKELRRIFIDKKVPRKQRECWPVVIDRTGRIIWLPGLSVAPLETVTKMSQKCVRMTFETRDETLT